MDAMPQSPSPLKAKAGLVRLVGPLGPAVISGSSGAVMSTVKSRPLAWLGLPAASSWTTEK